MKVAIFGSCASRDAFAFSPRPGLKVAEYIARSSIASAFHNIPVGDRWLAAMERIESPFQRRMVECDLLKLAQNRLVTSTPDLVLVDLIDERFNLVALGESFATWSSEFSKLGFDRTEFDDVLRIDSIERKRLWREGAKTMIQTIGTDRVVINEVYWSRELADGQPMAALEQIEHANVELRQMYDFIQSLGANRAIRYPANLLRADPKHKWGLTPFHFIPQFYDFTMSALEAF